jgi:hypothetical protein
MTVPKVPDTGAQETESASKNPELDRIRRYFNRETTEKASRFDGFGKRNDHTDYYDRSVHPESDRTRACVSVEWVAFSEIAQDADMVYVPCGISSGLRAHELLDQQNRAHRATGGEQAVTTYKAEEHLGPKRHHDMVMEPNKADNLRRARITGRTQPDKMIIAPVVREGAVRELTRTGAFSRWQRYEEEDFMAFWYPIIDKCKGMVLDGDWNYSRNSLWEMMRGTLIQAGQIPSRPKSDMDVRDLEGRPVTLQARAEKVVEMLKYQLGKGFEPREAATALAQIFTLDDDIRSGKIQDDSLHEVLRHRPPAELRAMDSLKAEFKPILLNHCAQLMRLDDLPEEYRTAASAEPQPLPADTLEAFRAFAEGISARSLDILSVQPSRELMARLATSEPSPQRLFDSHERFFEKNAQAKMFEDDLYSKLSEWERLALPFAIGATETGLYPTGKPMATMIFTDLKRGMKGFIRAQAQDPKVHDMNEFAGAQGRDIADIISSNASDAEALKARLKAENPGQIVVNTPSFLRIADTIEHFRKVDRPEDRPNRFIAAPGPSETSPLMRLALQMKYLDRNVDRAVFQEGWEYSNDLVQLRVRARMIQAGLVERPAGSQSPLRVVSAADPATPETLLDDIKLLTREVKRAAAAGVHAPEQALALVRLITLHELLVDPTLQQSGGKQTRELVSTLTADESLTCYNRAEARTVIEEAKELLTDKDTGVAWWIPRERLEVKPSADDDDDKAAAKVVQNRRMDDYIKAQDSQRGGQALAKQRTVHDDVHVARRGAGR